MFAAKLTVYGVDGGCRARSQAEKSAHVDDVDGVQVDVVVDEDPTAVRNRGHAVIGHYDEVRAVSQAEACHTGDELAQRQVQMSGGGEQFGRVRSMVVAGVIDFAEIDGDERWPLVLGERERRQHLRHAIGIRHVIVEGNPVGRSNTSDWRFGPGPEHDRRRAAPLADCRYPDRLAAPPARIVFCRRRHREAFGEAGLSSYWQ